MIGTNIYNIRKSRGLSLTELSERAGISKSYLSNIERNLNKNPSIQILGKIAFVLNVDLKALIHSDIIQDKFQQVDKEWIDLLKDLKESGLEKEQLGEFRQVIDYIIWKNNKKENRK